MNGATEHIEDLIGRYVVGEATKEQSQELLEWCALSPDNQKYVDDAQVIFEKATLPGEGNFDAEHAWSKVLSQIENKVKTRFLLPTWSIAASVVLVLGLSLFLFKPWLQKEAFELVAENEVETHLMPDRTEIALNRQSTVSVSYNERRKTGTILLEGEALISIPEDKKVNWTVDASGLLIEDIGTVFQVDANPTKTIFEVSVIEGMVRLYTKESEGITISAGEKGTYDRSSSTFSKVQPDPNAASFVTREFDFQEESLTLIIDKLSKVYGQDIILEGPIGDCKLTVAFENESLETILEIITETLNLVVLRNGSTLTIRGDGCF